MRFQSVFRKTCASCCCRCVCLRGMILHGQVRPDPVKLFPETLPGRRDHIKAGAADVAADENEKTRSAAHLFPADPAVGTGKQRSASFVIFFSLSGIVESSFTEQPKTSIAFCRENDNSRRKKLCNAGTGIKNRPLPEGRGLLAYPYDINNLQWIAGDSCKPQCADGMRCPDRFYVRSRRKKPLTCVARPTSGYQAAGCPQVNWSCFPG